MKLYYPPNTSKHKIDNCSGLPEEDIRTYLAPTATNCFIMRERETEFEMVTDCKDLPQWNQTTVCKVTLGNECCRNKSLPLLQLGVREEHTIPVTQFITLTKESDNSWLMKM